MKKVFRPLAAFALLLSLVVPAIADTIHLKDGSVIRGQVVGFKDQQFTILIGAGTKGRRSRTMVYVEDVESIEFDSATGAAAGLTNEETSASANVEPVSKPPLRNPPTDSTATVSRASTAQPSSGAAPTFFTIKIAVLVVRKGQRLRINASGRVSLGNGRFSTPAGIPTIPDNDKLMRTEATGALIAVIGDDNDDFIFLAARRDFVAQRDGVLFLGVNEGNLTDNTGTYDVVIEAEAGGTPR